MVETPKSTKGKHEALKRIFLKVKEQMQTNYCFYIFSVKAHNQTCENGLR